MRNSQDWKATKYLLKRGQLVASADSSEVSVASRLSANLVAEHYSDQLSRHARGRLLDLGCGKVPLFEAYKDYVDEVICADWLNSLHKSPYIDVVCDLASPLPFGDGLFNTIILSSVLEHIPEPALLWAEMTRILAPGGKIIMNSPFFYCIHEAPHDYYRYTEFALRRFITVSGLELINIEATGGVPEILVDVFSKTMVRFAGVGHLIALLCQWMAWLFRKTSWGRRQSIATSRTFPLSYFVIAMKPVESAVVTDRVS